MTFRKVLALAAITAGSLTPMPAHAATKTIEVRTAEYTAYAVKAVAADTIIFKAMSGRHNVVAYDGATWDSTSQYPSGMVAYNDGFRPTFPGGTVKYRCTLFTDGNPNDPVHPEPQPYSRLDAQGNCTGMCGSVTDKDVTIPGAPTITSPVTGATLTSNAVTVSGSVPTGAQDVKIKIGGVLAAIVPNNEGVFSTQFDRPNGSYTFTAISRHAEGFESDPSAPVTVSIQAADALPPTVDIQSPKNTFTFQAVNYAVTTAPLKIAGRASDDVSVTTVSIVVRDEILGGDYHPTVVYVPDSAKTGVFSATVPVGTGRYTITVTAKDGSGKEGSASKVAIVVA